MGRHRERTWRSAVSTWMGAFASAAQSVPCQGTLRHVIDLHAQAPYFFIITLTPSFTLCIPVKRGPTALLNHTIGHCPASTSQRKGRQMCINRAACRGLGGPTSLGFWFNQGVTCVARNGDAAFSDHRSCSFSFAVCTWPLTDILSTHTRIQWYTRVTVDPHTGCHCMRRSQ